MVDRLLHCDPVTTTTLFTIRPDNILLDRHIRLSSSGLLENIAQTCAARMGYINLINNKSVKLGFIGAVKNFIVHRNPSVEETLTTTITVLNEILSLTLVKAEVLCNDEIVAECEMKIALSEIDK